MEQNNNKKNTKKDLGREIETETDMDIDVEVEIWRYVNAAIYRYRHKHRPRWMHGYTWTGCRYFVDWIEKCMFAARRNTWQILSKMISRNYCWLPHRVARQAW